MATIFRKDKSRAHWINEIGMAEVVENKGKLWRTMGVVRSGETYYSIEETLYVKWHFFCDFFFFFWISYCFLVFLSKELRNKLIICFGDNMKPSIYKSRALESVWYMCLKTENYCLKTFVEIRVSEKVWKYI